jgi:hypothetical protein
MEGKWELKTLKQDRLVANMTCPVSPSAVAFSPAAPVSIPTPEARIHKKEQQILFLSFTRTRSSCSLQNTAARPHRHSHHRCLCLPLPFPLLAAVVGAVVSVACHLHEGVLPIPGDRSGGRDRRAMAAPKGPNTAIKLFGRTIAVPDSTGATAEVRASQPLEIIIVPVVIGGGQDGHCRPFLGKERRVKKRDQMNLFL